MEVSFVSMDIILYDVRLCHSNRAGSNEICRFHFFAFITVIIADLHR